MRGVWIVAAAMTALATGTASSQDPGRTPAPVPPAGEAAPVPDEGGAEAEEAEPLGEGEAMVLNFDNIDIREVIRSLAEALGIAYTIDPRVEGQITLRTTGRIPREDLFPLLNLILRNNGIAMVKVGGIYQILPVGEAKTRAIIPKAAAETARTREEDSFVIEIARLEHVSSDEMVTILQPFVTPGGDVFSYPRANVLVITDLHSNVARLRDLIDTFDTNVFRDLHARVFKVTHGDPEELANEVLALLAPFGVTATGEGEGGTFVMPLQRLNAIVVIAADPAIFAEFERWLRMLDIPPEESAGRRTFVYNVENAKAIDLAAVLNELFGGGPGGGAGAPGRTGTTPAGVGLFGAGGAAGRGGAGRTGGGRRGGLGGGGGVGSAANIGQAGAAGSTSLGGGAAGGGRLGGGRRGGIGGAGGIGAGGQPGQPGQAGQPGGGARGVTLPGGTAAAVPGQPGQQGPPPIFKQEVRIVADEVTNSLIILATRRDFELILDVLRRIDVVPRQVVLEVTIAEIQLNKNLEFGVAWALAEGRLADTVAQNNAASNIFGTAPRGLPVGGFNSGVPRVPGAPGAFAVISDREHFNLFINALASKTNVKMLSAPHIVAADNREAHILIGESIPILTSTASNILQAGNTATVNSVQYRDTGKILTVLPQVNSKGLVNLQLRQEVSAVGAASFGSTGSPSFTTREAETTVVVQDGHSVIIGGIIDDSIRHDRTGIPYFMDIPVIGRAFRIESDSTTRTELIVLITPYVIRSVREADDVTGDLVDRVEGLNRLRAIMKPQTRRQIGDVPPPIEEPAGPTSTPPREGRVEEVNPPRPGTAR